METEFDKNHSFLSAPAIRGASVTLFTSPLVDLVPRKGQRRGCRGNGGRRRGAGGGHWKGGVVSVANGGW